MEYGMGIMTASTVDICMRVITTVVVVATDITKIIICVVIELARDYYR